MSFVAEPSKNKNGDRDNAVAHEIGLSDFAIIAGSYKRMLINQRDCGYQNADKIKFAQAEHEPDDYKTGD